MMIITNTVRLSNVDIKVGADDGLRQKLKIVFHFVRNLRLAS